MPIGLVLAAYLLLVSAAVALWALPSWRRGLAKWTRRRLGRSRDAGAAALDRTRRLAGALPQQARRAAAALPRSQPLRWTQALALALVLLLPSGLALWLGTGRLLTGGDDVARAPIDPRIAALLQGEQLVPPAPLPPEVFATREVEIERPLLAGASREWAALDADFRQRLLLVFRTMRDQHGYDLALLEGYRSPERQELLRARGTQTTLAGANQSYHQFGLAADCAFYRDGKLVISEKDPWARRGYDLYGQVAESVGLHWGGRWRSLVDLGHVELRRPGVLAKATRDQD